MEDKTNKKLIRIISEISGIDEEKITLDAKIEDLVHDSFHFFELIPVLERKFGLKLDYKELTRIKTIGDVITRINSKNKKI